MENAHLENWKTAFAAGLAGAVALTGAQHLARKLTRAQLPVEPSLYRMALAGDIVANSAYYSLIACGRDPRIWTRAVTMGVGAGVAALALPHRLRLGDPPRASTATRIMTIAWYLAGALTTAATAEYLLTES